MSPELTVLQAAFLGFVQGLTEFLPVSSSGHLAFFEHVFGFKQPNLFFDIMLHIGTLTAVLIYFWRDILNLIIDVIVGIIELLRGERWSDVTFKNPKLKFFVLIIVAMIPTGLMGFFLKDFFEGLFGSLLAIGFAFWITTLFVWLTQFVSQGYKSEAEMGFWSALVIGIFQGLAITPGISRSGSTIAAALFCKIDRELAARFSFILSIPAILAALLLESKDLAQSGQSVPYLLPVIVGTVIAAVVGYIAIRFLIKVLVQGSFHRFAYYTLFMGGLSLLISLFGK